MVDSDNLAAKVKFQSETDATLHYLNSASFTDAIESTIKRMHDLFEEKIPEELVKKQYEKRMQKMLH